MKKDDAGSYVTKQGQVVLAKKATEPRPAVVEVGNKPEYRDLDHSLRLIGGMRAA